MMASQGKPLLKLILLHLLVRRMGRWNINGWTLNPQINVYADIWTEADKYING